MYGRSPLCWLGSCSCSTAKHSRWFRAAYIPRGEAKRFAPPRSKEAAF